MENTTGQDVPRLAPATTPLDMMVDFQNTENPNAIRCGFRYGLICHVSETNGVWDRACIPEEPGIWPLLYYVPLLDFLTTCGKFVAKISAIKVQVSCLLGCHRPRIVYQLHSSYHPRFTAVRAAEMDTPKSWILRDSSALPITNMAR